MRYLGLVLILITLFSCKKDNSFIIQGKVLNRESGIVRFNQLGEKYYDAEVCEMIDGEFSFKGETELPEEFFISYKENESSRGTNYFKFFVEPAAEIRIILNPENINKSVFEGSKIGEEYWSVSQTIYNEFNSKVENLIPEYEIAQETDDSVQLKKVVKTLDSITNQTQKWELDYIWNHPNSYISANRLYQRQFNLDLDTLQKYFDKLDKNLNESKYYKSLKSYLSVQVGKPFLDFELPDSAGIMHRFSSVAKNKVTLIDFWFSSCGPCRKQNQQLKQLYETYKSKGFEVVGVSTDKNPSDFIKAINEDKMTWLNLLDNTNAESVESIYGANTVPFNILIDENGLIVYKANDYKNLKSVVDSLMSAK